MRPDRSQVSQSTRFPEQDISMKHIRRLMYPSLNVFNFFMPFVITNPMLVDFRDIRKGINNWKSILCCPFCSKGIFF